MDVFWDDSSAFLSFMLFLKYRSLEQNSYGEPMPLLNILTAAAHLSPLGCFFVFLFFEMASRGFVKCINVVSPSYVCLQQCTTVYTKTETIKWTLKPSEMLITFADNKN